MSKTRVWRQEDEKKKNEKKEALAYYNSAIVCLDPANLSVEKCYTEGKKQYYLLRIKISQAIVLLILNEKQKTSLYKNILRQRLKGTIETVFGKTKYIQMAIPDFLYIKVENIRQYREGDGSNVVKLKGIVTEIKEKKKYFSIKIRVYDQEFPCIIAKERLTKYGVKVGDYVETKAHFNTRDFYIDDEVYEDSYTELVIYFIKVQH